MDDFRTLQMSMRSSGCAGWWEDVIPQLDEKRHEDLLGAAADRHISHRVISIVLGQWGFDVSAAQVGHWRRNHVG